MDTEEQTNKNIGDQLKSIKLIIRVYCKRKHQHIS